MPTRPPKRRSKPARSSKAKPKKRPRSPKKKKRAKKRARSRAAKKGWAKRRKKKRLIDAMLARKGRQIDNEQPAGWIERRTKVREFGGDEWQQIEFDYDQSAHDAIRFETLRELGIDLLTRDELYDYLVWIAEEEDIEISDMYRMYLGYRIGEGDE